MGAFLYVHGTTPRTEEGCSMVRTSSPTERGTMPDTPNRGSVTKVAKIIGRSETSIRKYIEQTTDALYMPPGSAEHPLGLEAHATGLTLDVELTRAYAASRPKGRPSKWTGQGA